MNNFDKALLHAKYQWNELLARDKRFFVFDDLDVTSTEEGNGESLVTWCYAQCFDYVSNLLKLDGFDITPDTLFDYNLVKYDE